MKILLLGANGQVGHELRWTLAPLGELVCATRTGVLAGGFPCLVTDLSSSLNLAQVLDAVQPNIIVNAAAYTAVDRAEDESTIAARINHYAVEEIGAWAMAHGARVIHYSTDYVFDGESKRPYYEVDPTRPMSVYGHTKLKGEQALAASRCAHIILRTAWVYAARGHNFLRTLFRLATEKEELKIVDDQVGVPTSANEVAGATAALLMQWMRMDSSAQVAVCGVYHLVASGQTTWFKFAEAIVRDATTAGLLVRIPRILPITTSDYPTRAVRPAYSKLNCEKLKQVFGLQLPPWQDSLRLVLGEMKENTFSTPHQH